MNCCTITNRDKKTSFTEFLVRNNTTACHRNHFFLSSQADVGTLNSFHTHQEKKVLHRTKTQTESNSMFCFSKSQFQTQNIYYIWTEKMRSHSQCRNIWREEKMRVASVAFINTISNVNTKSIDMMENCQQPFS